MPQIKNFTMVNDLSSRKKIPNDPSIFGPTEKTFNKFKEAHTKSAVEIKKPKKPFPWFQIGKSTTGIAVGMMGGRLYDYGMETKWLIVYGIVFVIAMGMMEFGRDRE